MIAICLPTSLKSACWAQAEQETTSNATADAAFRNQEILMNVKRYEVWNVSRKCHDFFGSRTLKNRDHFTQAASSCSTSAGSMPLWPPVRSLPGQMSGH